MHFQVIKDDLFDKIVVILKKNIPEFNTVFDIEDGIYPIMGEFANFMIVNENNQELMQKCFAFINQIIENGGSETEDVIAIQIFEKFHENEKMLLLANKYLIGKAREIFDNITN